MANGIFDGTNMDKEITPEQLTTMRYRYAKFQGADVSKTTSLDSLKVSGKVSVYGVDALKWGIAESVVTGKSGNVIDPQAGAARAEIATMFMGFRTLHK